MNRTTILAVLFSVPVLSAMGALIHPNPTEAGLATVGILNAVWLTVSLSVALDVLSARQNEARSETSDQGAHRDSSSKRAA